MKGVLPAVTPEPLSPLPSRPVPPSGGSVLALLEDLRGLQRARLRGIGLLWAFSILLLLGCGGLWSASTMPTLGRACCVLGILGALGVWTVYARWVTRRQVGDLFRTARWMGERAPHLSLGVLGAVELGVQLEKAKPDFSSTLAHAHLHSLATQASRLNLALLLDSRPLRRAQATFSVALALVLFGLLFSSARLQAGWHALRPRASDVLLTERAPITGEVELTYRYPAYTGLESRTVPGTNGEVNAPLGTEVTLRTRSDRTVARAELRIVAQASQTPASATQGTHAGDASPQAIPLRVTANRDLSGSFAVSASGSYRFVFSSSRGRQLAEGPDVAIHAEPDAPPSVTLLTPPQELEVQPEERLTLKYQAQDDYGLTALELVWQRASGPEQRLKLALTDRKRLAGQYTWELKSLGLQEGDRVAYRIEARDNRALQSVPGSETEARLSGPQRGSSRAHVLKVYSAAEHRRAALERAQQLWEKYVRHLADRLEGDDRARPRRPEATQAGARLDQQGDELSRGLVELGAQLRRDRDAPAGLAPAVAHVGEQLHQRVRDTALSRANFNRGPPGFDTLPSAVSQEIESSEHNVLYLESLLQMFKAQMVQQLARKLENERRALMSRLQEYGKTHDPAAQKALLEQVAAMRQRMQEMMRQMAQLEQGLLDQHLSQEALETPKMGEELDKLQELIKQGKADEALAQLQKLDGEMKSLSQQLERTARSSGPSDPQLNAQMQEFQKQLHETTRTQQQLAEKTKAVRNRYREQRKQNLAAHGEKLREQLLKEAQALAKDYHDLPPEDSMGTRRSLSEATSELENLQSALKGQDFDLASESARRVERAAQDLANGAELHERREQFTGAPASEQREAKAQSQRMQKDAQRAHDIARRLSELFPPMGQMMSEADRREMQQMAKGQRALQQQMDGLRSKMSQLQQRAPIFGKEAQEQMQSIGDQMNEAGQELEGQEAGRAHSQQRAALEGLQQFADKMQKAQQSGSGNPGGEGMPMPMDDGEGREEGAREFSHQKVEIPDAEDSQAPPEFRKDLLEAMKQGVPERYREQVKHYYEELVQ